MAEKNPEPNLMRALASLSAEAEHYSEWRGTSENIILPGKPQDAAIAPNVDAFVERCRELRHGSPNAFYAHVDRFCKEWLESHR